MATGVPPREDEFQFSKIDFENIQDAMKSKKFRDMFVDYCNEVRDPANQALYQKEMTQLEKERGYDITFINPVEGYVIKTSVAGDRKAFINICSNDNVGKPECNVDRVNGQRGLNWQIPYSLLAPREDMDKKRQRFVIYDVIFHPDTLRIASQNKQFRELVNKTAFDALHKNYNVHLDNNNFKCPKTTYKGMVTPGVIRKEDPNFEPPSNEEEEESLPPELLEKLYPQKSYGNQQNTSVNPNYGEGGVNKHGTIKSEAKNINNKIPLHRKRTKSSNEYIISAENGYTKPKYVIKQQKNVDLQDFTYDKDCKLNSAIPSQLVVEVNLPLLSSTSDCILDVQERSLSLKSEAPAKYQLSITLPYPVCESNGNAKFDKTRRKLIVTLPVIRKQQTARCDLLKVDSGVESEGNSESHSDEEGSRKHLIEELPSNVEDSNKDLYVAEEVAKPNIIESFFNPSLGYSLPSYTHNVLDDTIAFTFHVKNTEPDSVKALRIGNKIYVKFTSIGSGFVPTHYGALIILNNDNTLETVTAEAWDNNVILLMEFAGDMPSTFEIGLNEETLATKQIDLPITQSSQKDLNENLAEPPSVEVLNLGSETNIVFSSNDSETSNETNDGNELSDETEAVSPMEREIVVVETEHNSNAKSILRKSMGRSYSESSYCDLASSVDVSSDYIPEESSLRKSVRFSNVIARQFYRYNSSIEGQKKKNQRKKNKKKNLERRKSESEAEDDTVFIEKNDIAAPKSVSKSRRDSGLADTSDAETDKTDSTPNSYNPQEPQNNTDNTTKTILNIVDRDHSQNIAPTIWETNKHGKKGSPKQDKPKTKAVTCETIQHKTDLYNPENLNKGQYLEVKFKNDLIFDLDM